MALPGFHSPAAGFEQPFELLGACHERVHRTLALLARLQQHLELNGCDEQAKQAALDVMRYFDVAAPLHHEDEELHVFPSLLRFAPPEIKLLVYKLQGDHLQMQLRWVDARTTLRRVAECCVGNWRPLTPSQTASLQHFADLYAGHIEAEEQIAYPCAQKYLTSEDVQNMQADMMLRRGVNATGHGNPQLPQQAQLK